MATLQQQLENADLSDACKADLANHMKQLELEGTKLQKSGVTTFNSNLPEATKHDTVTHSNKRIDESVKNESRSALMTKKNAQQEERTDLLNSVDGGDSRYAKPLNSKYHNQPNTRDPFRESRRKDQLSGKDEDFVHRYAEALTQSKIERPEKTDPATVAATEAYIAKFRACMGREPTAKELEEVNRLNFGFDESGNIGVIQKPHSSHPHYHYTNSKQCTTDCSCQAYKPEVPQVKGARDRYPGPVPVWSSTKNSSTLVGGDTYQPGQHNNNTTLKREAMNSVTGPK
ncbi:hypothetical protein AGDE_03199 [Angomonas deanei]|uniref:Uncharacterized protein n=1 Tax=Angomonas deanei TaxID=59799 RepID=S9VIM9_9TRYP|nr:hypothetical protein AGDE_08285 [Angomonas deanei]EPY37892.1 hypothetical protein AGDE_06041 [Angomonas deanei]EPY40728.1 hypothetical protein AGDE_03199 [Angomonas deanei]CAD2219973.1 hypothetical protein, conserved [Angomonas deanei]|eukprot:EPY33435.1 hypothetical protein AGDE_08285 [Angomonas deanei]